MVLRRDSLGEGMNPFLDDDPDDRYNYGDRARRKGLWGQRKAEGALRRAERATGAQEGYAYGIPGVIDRERPGILQAQKGLLQYSSPEGISQRVNQAGTTAKAIALRKKDEVQRKRGAMGVSPEKTGWQQPYDIQAAAFEMGARERERKRAKDMALLALKNAGGMGIDLANLGLRGEGMRLDALSDVARQRHTQSGIYDSIATEAGIAEGLQAGESNLASQAPLQMKNRIATQATEQQYFPPRVEQVLKKGGIPTSEDYYKEYLTPPQEIASAKQVAPQPQYGPLLSANQRKQAVNAGQGQLEDSEETDEEYFL